ncbi:unnamed protein product [Orchesella dallaii]|uniref:Uncharacterized protein n=1 Tax=Orchesella dallaii TaxID=48710 RepID=A0ABP1S6F3_9HEXA
MSDQAPSTYSLNSILVANNDEDEGATATLLANKHVHLLEKKLEKDAHTVLILHATGTTTSPEVTVPVPSPNKDCVNVQSENTPKLNTQTNSQAVSLVDKFFKICGKKVYNTNVYSTWATIASLSLLLLYIVTIHAKDSSDEIIRTEIISIARNAGLNELAGNLDEFSKLKLLPIASLKDWNYIETLGSRENVLHFTVGHHTDNHYLTGTIDDGALKISGKPKFCKHSDRNTPEELSFKNVTHLHLSGMQNCSHYTNLILTKWHFPKVQKIKMHQMIIGEQEFNGLRKFIDRCNETLLKVEIDESYICPSPVCDAGMIDFPNHDFQLLVTRRRESPSWVLQ